MAEFLQLFIPTIAFMLVPLFIPILTVGVGALRDALSGENRVESVEDRVRARLEKRELAAQAA